MTTYAAARSERMMRLLGTFGELQLGDTELDRLAQTLTDEEALIDVDNGRRRRRFLVRWGGEDLPVADVHPRAVRVNAEHIVFLPAGQDRLTEIITESGA